MIQWCTHKRHNYFLADFLNLRKCYLLITVYCSYFWFIKIVRWKIPFLWDSLHRSPPVERSLLWLSQVLVCLKADGIRIHSVARMIQIWLKIILILVQYLLPNPTYLCMCSSSTNHHCTKKTWHTVSGCIVILYHSLTLQISVHCDNC